jgi:hypothetical protein
MKTLVIILSLLISVAFASEFNNGTEHKNYKYSIDSVPFYIPLDSDMSMNGDQTEKVSVFIMPNEGWLKKHHIKGRFNGGVYRFIY